VHFNEYISRLRTRLTSALPGLEAQRIMAPRGRLTVGHEAEPHDARHGAVLILLFDRGTGPELPLIVRADDGGTHGGQIGLPGGGFEEGDEFPTGTALREAEEEIAAAPHHVDVLGSLTPLYIRVSNYRITPVVGTYSGDPASFSPNPTEVSRIIIAGIDELMAGHEYRTVDARGTPLHVPAYGFGEVDVWGATAMMLSEFFSVHREVRGR
jgi:8-oxo-dGTP pyrophosphatase MutT (NUDIX family)